MRSNISRIIGWQSEIMMDFGLLQEQLDKERRKVDVDHFDITIRELVRMAVEGELKRAPVYQRKFRWSPENESLLVESLFLGLPVPSIFVATNSDGTWELVDGLQRISTLLHYTAVSEAALREVEKDSPLRIQGLEKLQTFNGLTFEDLPIPLQLAFNKRSLRVTSLSDKSDRVARFDLFERLNTGGIALTPQEVRACIYRGEFAEFIRDLSREPKFRSLLKLQRKLQDDGTREEIVLKFFAYLYARSDFKGNVKKFLNDYMEKASNEFTYDENRELFLKTVEQIATSLNGPFQRTNVNVTPLNQLEAVMVGVGSLILQEKEIIRPDAGWIDDEELVAYSTGATNTRKKLESRIARAIHLFSNG